MSLFADSEGPEQADLGFRCLHMPEDKFSHDAAHLMLENINDVIQEKATITQHSIPMTWKSKKSWTNNDK